MVLSILLAGCSKEPDRMDDYLVEFATLLREAGSIRFALDNGRVLVPVNDEKASGDNGQRVLLNYVPLKGDSIKINYASPIFTASIEPDGFPERYANDPVKLQSVWVGGDYLNLIMEVEYHSKPHSIALLRDRAASGIDLYVSHSRNDDPPGAMQVMHASFSLVRLKEESSDTTIPFRLIISTHDGLRIFELEY